MSEKKIVLLAGKGIPTNIVFNAVNSEHPIQLAIIEEREPMKKFLLRRIKRLGFINVMGQVIFQVFIFRILKFFSKKRYEEILSSNRLNTEDIPHEKIKFTNSVNSNETINLLKEINPDLIIVNGTRIISKKVLSTINCTFINTHVGITPKYRGVHGAYWAMVNKDEENCGVTVHLVDEGIDTGNILYQSKVTITKKDNFFTYPFIQLSEGVKLLSNAIAAFYNNELQPQKEKPGESKIWYHPTCWQYIYYWLFRGIK